MDKIVRDQLNSFLQKHVPEASISVLDDVILDYVVEVLSNLKDHEDNSFDVEELCEMIAAYVPEFAQVDSTVVCEWVFEVAHKLQSHCLEGSPQQCDNDNLKTALSEQNVLPDDAAAQTDELATHNTEKEPHLDATEPIFQHSNHSHLESVDPDNLSLLMEMFPDCTESDITATLRSHHCDMDQAIQVLLERCSISQSEHTVELEKKELKPHFKKEELCVKDNHLKDTILTKYAFVDTKDDKLSHRPCLPAQEPKKLVRYRDNHVVNTKGERYTVVTKKDQEGDEMKKTYVSIKPLKKYRFH